FVRFEVVQHPLPSYFVICVVQVAPVFILWNLDCLFLEEFDRFRREWHPVTPAVLPQCPRDVMMLLPWFVVIPPLDPPFNDQRFCRRGYRRPNYLRLAGLRDRCPNDLRLAGRWCRRDERWHWWQRDVGR